MTNHWNDIGNADVIMARGGNPAENHPAAFGHITIAKDKGAKLISIDPRFTRTSAKADVYAPIRSGTDVAFVGGMRKYDKATWQYQVDDNTIPIKDKTLEDPNCVFQVLKRQYARYTPAKVNAV